MSTFSTTNNPLYDMKLLENALAASEQSFKSDPVYSEDKAKLWQQPNRLGIPLQSLNQGVSVNTPYPLLSIE